MHRVLRSAMLIGLSAVGVVALAGCQGSIIFREQVVRTDDLLAVPGPFRPSAMRAWASVMRGPSGWSRSSRSIERLGTQDADLLGLKNGVYELQLIQHINPFGKRVGKPAILRVEVIDGSVDVDRSLPTSRIAATAAV